MSKVVALPEPTPYLKPFPHADFEYIIDADVLEECIEERLSRPIPALGLDTETTGTRARTSKLRLIQIAIKGFPVIVVDWFKIDQELARIQLERLLNNPNILKIGHFLLFELEFLLANSIRMCEPFWDTFYVHKALYNGLKISGKLSNVVEICLSQTLDKSLQVSDWGANRLSKKQVQYGADDAAVELDVQRIQELNLSERVRSEENVGLQRICQLENRILIDVARMGHRGIQIDLNVWKEYRDELHKERDQALREVQQLTVPSEQMTLFAKPVNPNSNKELLAALRAIGAEVEGTAERDLVPIANEFPVARSIIRYRQLEKLCGLFEKTLPKHIDAGSRLHPQWNQWGAMSGRITSEDPCLTNVPKHPAARRCYVAAEGHVLIRADYSQIELRILAKLCNDERLVQAFQNKEDVHRLVANYLLGKPMEDITEEERKTGKIFNFGMVYLMSADKFQATALIEYDMPMPLDECEEFMERYFELFPGVRKWHKQRQADVYKRGLQGISTPLGRQRRWNGKPRLTEFVNHPVQGTNADIMKMALLKLRRLLEKYSAGLVGIIYDEILVECPEQHAKKLMPLIQQRLIEAAQPVLDPIPVQVDISVAKSWGG